MYTRYKVLHLQTGIIPYVYIFTMGCISKNVSPTHNQVRAKHHLLSHKAKNNSASEAGRSIPTT